jgi:hypothetical protein
MTEKMGSKALEKSNTIRKNDSLFSFAVVREVIRKIIRSQHFFVSSLLTRLYGLNCVRNG